MKVVILILFFNLFTSCSQESKISNKSEIAVQNTLVKPIEQTVKEKPLEKLKFPKEKIKLPNIKDFGLSTFVRKSNQKNESGQKIPPFYEAEISISLDYKPKVGEKVTVIPLYVNLEPFQLSITKTEKREVECNGDKEEFYWDTEIEKLSNKEILEIAPVKNNSDEFPFELMVIYPSVDFAKNIETPALTKEMLPKNISIETVEAAIDLDNDGKPDLLEIAFCCSNPTEKWNENNDCYTCEKSFKKINGMWKLADSETPC